MTTNEKKTERPIEYDMKKIRLTDEMVDRIKLLQNTKPQKHSNAKMAGLLDISTDAYKNIIYKKNTYIKTSLLKRMQELFHCSFDYLICKSSEPNLTRNNTSIPSPISFDMRDQKIASVIDFLHHDHKTLNNLYLLLCEFPPTLRKNMLSSFNSICDNIRITSLIKRQDNLSEDSLNYIIKLLEKDSPELTEMNLKLTEADQQLKCKHYRTASDIYLEIIYYSSIEAFPALKIALSKLKALDKDWKKHPEEFDKILKKIPESPNLSNSELIDLQKKLEAPILDYADSRNIELISPADYRWQAAQLRYPK